MRWQEFETRQSLSRGWTTTPRGVFLKKEPGEGRGLGLWVRAVPEQRLKTPVQGLFESEWAIQSGWL